MSLVRVNLKWTNQITGFAHDYHEGDWLVVHVFALTTHNPSLVDIAAAT